MPGRMLRTIPTQVGREVLDSRQLSVGRAGGGHRFDHTSAAGVCYTAYAAIAVALLLQQPSRISYSHHIPIYDHAL